MWDSNWKLLIWVSKFQNNIGALSVVVDEYKRQEIGHLVINEKCCNVEGWYHS